MIRIIVARRSRGGTTDGRGTGGRGEGTAGGTIVDRTKVVTDFMPAPSIRSQFSSSLS